MSGKVSGSAYSAGMGWSITNAIPAHGSMTTQRAPWLGKDTGFQEW